MDSTEYIVYRRFADEDLARTYAEILRDHQIRFLVEEFKEQHDVMIPNLNQFKEYLIKIEEKDFDNVNRIFLNYEKEKIENTNSNYYLYSFSNEELIDLISDFYEWSEYDYLLAQEILKKRDYELTDEQIKDLQNKKLNELAQPHKGSVFLIGAGYFFAIFGGIIGIAIGYNLAYHKQLLPNNKSVPYYTAKTRGQGLNIFWIGILSFFIWTILGLMRQKF